MDEYEQIETEIQKLYSGYIQKFRNLHYLEHRIKDIEEQEKVRLKDRQHVMAKWITQMQQEELSILRNDGDIFSSFGSDKLQDALSSSNSGQGSGANLSNTPSRSNVSRPPSKTSPSRSEKKPTILMGSMTAGDDDDDDVVNEPIQQVRPTSRQNYKFTAVVDGDETSSHIYDF